MMMTRMWRNGEVKVVVEERREERGERAERRLLGARLIPLFCIVYPRWVWAQARAQAASLLSLLSVGSR